VPCEVLAIQDAAGDFLDAAFGHIDPGQSVTLEQRQRSAHLVLHLLGRGITTAWPALLADLLQAFGPDRQAMQLFAVR